MRVLVDIEGDTEYGRKRRHTTIAGYFLLQEQEPDKTRETSAAMPFGSHSRNPSTNTSSAFLSAGGALAAFASPSIQRMSVDGKTSDLTKQFNEEQNSTTITDTSTTTTSNRNSIMADQPLSPRRQHSHHDSTSNSNSNSNPYPPQQAYALSPPSAPPTFNIQPASGMLPSNAASSNTANPTLPGALQPGGPPSASSSTRPATSGGYSAPSTIPSMAPPLPSNAQHYAQAQQSQPSLSRQNTLHQHSLSSPSGMDGPQKYIPFNQTPTTSNPKAYNISNAQTPVAGGPSHSPLNLTDIRSRAISDVGDGPQGTAFFSYADQPINSNYLAPFPTYAFDWCKWPVLGGSGAGKMAVGSYLEDPHNFIQILDTHITPQEVTSPGQTPYGLEYTKVAEATCAYPVTRILWEPPSSQKQSTDLLATSGDHLRLWSLPQGGQSNITSNINRSAAANLREPAPQKLQPLALLSNSKTPEHTAPLTSLDWNTLSPKLIITSSIDTTCTIWDIPTLTAKTQLIAHDKEVFDVRFCAGSVDVFVSCGADGSVRMFDLRSLEHSTIIYEPADKSDNKCEYHQKFPSDPH